MLSYYGFANANYANSSLSVGTHLHSGTINADGLSPTFFPSTVSVVVKLT